MGLIITLEEERKELDLNEERDQELIDLYNSDSLLKEEADKLHHARMLPGNACPQCIEAILERRKDKL
jgi:hypothetical protein